MLSSSTLRRILAPSISIVIVAIRALGAEPVEYPVRNIDPASPKFDAIHKAVIETERLIAESKAELRWVEIRQHIEGNRYLAEIREKTSPPGELQRAVDFLFNQQSASVVVREAQVAALDMPEGSPLIPDDSKKSLRLSITSDTFQYVSVLGAKQTVAVARVFEAPDPIGKEQFLARLKGGEVWTVAIGTSDLNCNACRGFGRIPEPDPNRRRGDGKKTCPGCSGKGKFTVPNLYRIHW